MKRVRNVGPSVPNSADVLGIHDKEVERSQDTLGVLNRGSLEAALDRAKFGPFEGPGSVLERGALLLRGICQDHPFVDGNKRTAFAATHMFPARNGYALEATAEVVRDFMLAVARVELDLDGILAWFARHVETVKAVEVQ
jgi:death on curing protein